jgi:hypothetical protein
VDLETTLKFQVIFLTIYFMVLLLKKTVEFLQEYYKMSNQLSDFGTLNKVLYHDCDNLASSLFYF